MNSVLTNDTEHCYFCYKKPHGVHHLIFGSSRSFADKYGLFVPICDECHTIGHLDDRRGLGFSKESRIHDNIMAEDLSKMLGEAVWYLTQVTTEEERKQLKQQFIKENGRSYL